MQEPIKRAKRIDASQNRERLLVAAREMFAGQGHDVALEEVARAASVSRTTLYRNFSTREELAATVFEENVALIEARSIALRGRGDGVEVLFDYVLDMVQENRALTQVLSGADIEWFIVLSGRTVAAFEPLLETGRIAGTVHADVVVDDIMIAFPMASGAFADSDRVGRDVLSPRVRAMLHRALFTPEQGRP